MTTCCHPWSPMALACDHSCSGSAMMITQVMYFSSWLTDSWISERVLVNFLASAAILLMYASGPTAAAVNRPVPATTVVPERTSSPAVLGIASASPVRLDSSISRPEVDSIDPSAGTWSPVRSSMRSSRTTSAVGISISAPSRSTLVVGEFSRASRSSFRLARYSWVMPIAELTMSTTPNSPSASDPVDRISTNNAPRIALNRVKTLVLKITHSERDDAWLVALTCPRATRSATCAGVRPSAPPARSATCADSGEMLTGQL